MKKIIFILIAFLMIDLAPPTIFHSAKSMGEAKKKADFMRYLWEEVPPTYQIYVLDVGCGMGYFIPKIRALFKDFDYTVQVDGLDNMSMFMARGKESDKALIKELEEARGGVKIWYLDIAKAYHTIRMRYDFIFINAPYPYTEESDRKFMEGSFKLLKDSGILFLRFHWGETHLDRVNWIREMCQHHNYQIVMRNTRGVLPAGMFPLDDELTWIIKKNHFASSDETVADSLGKLAEQVFAIKQSEKAA